LGELCLRLVEIAQAGLDRQASVAPSERVYLDSVHSALSAGRTPAQDMLQAWQNSGGDPANLADFLRLV
jgi:gamma-glutamylcysteine synthetase